MMIYNYLSIIVLCKWPRGGVRAYILKTVYQNWLAKSRRSYRPKDGFDYIDSAVDADPSPCYIHSQNISNFANIKIYFKI